MSKRCQRCGHQNGDEHFFCQQCGEALDADVRVIMNYEKMKKMSEKSRQTASRQDQDDDYVPARRPQKKEPSAALWVVLACLLAAVGVAAWVLLSH